MRTVRRGLTAAGLAVGALVAAPAAGVAAVAEVRVVTVLPGPDAGARSVVADVRPAPSAPLPGDAASVRVGATLVPATTTTLLARDAPTAVVVDASAAGAAALSQTLSGVAGYLLRLPSGTPVTVTADGGTPRAVTASPGRPADAIHAMTTVTAAGERSTAGAVELALAGLAPVAGRGGRVLVLLGTTGGPPEGQARARLEDRLKAAGAVLAVVTTPQSAPAWAPVADSTGGTAVSRGPDDVAGAFDAVTQVLRGRSVVTFTPPAGATSADLQVQVGGVRVSAAVALPAAAAATPGPSGQATTPAVTRSEGSSPGPVLALAVLVAALVAALVHVARRRRRQRRAPRAVPAAPVDASGQSTGRAPSGQELSPPGVRVFDVSDPHGPVELDPTATHHDGEVQDRSA
jgi:hypothetical protein